MKKQYSTSLYWLLGIAVIIIIAIFIHAGFAAAPEDNPAAMNATTTGSTPSSTTSVPTAKQANIKTNQTIQSGYVIIYTDKGFSPSTLQVPRGNSVKFENESSHALLVVSDNQSSIDNAINQPTAIQSGGVYSVDFDYAGVFSYHNAESPDDRGNVVVY